MNTRSYSAYARTPATPIEHTPIHDLPAYLASKKKAARLKKVHDSLAYLAILIIAYILLKIAGA